MTRDRAHRAKHNRAMLLALASVLLALGACASAQSQPRGVYAQFSPEGVTVYEAGAKILFYRMRPTEGAEPWRLHFIHPLYASSGQELTENAPADHLHHRGIFTAWRRILLDGRPAGDAWVGKDLVWTVATPTFRRNVRGAGVLTTHAVWSLTQSSPPRPLIEESTQITVEPLAAGVRRIDIRSRYTALAENVAVAGTDDEKEYGGPSIRLAWPDRLELASGGRPIKAKVGPVETGDEVEFRWRDSPAGWPRLIAASCSVDGRAWRRWVLRQELSMQNCAFPGRAPVTLPTKDALEIRLSLRIVE